MINLIILVELINKANAKGIRSCVTKYTSDHHAKRCDDINYFVGDIKLIDIHNIVPKSYKYFYDDEIKEMVYTYYKKDIEKYDYTFEEMV